MGTIIAAVITGAVTLVGVLLTNGSVLAQMQSDSAKAQAVTEAKLEELTREVRLHNNFARRMPVVEEQVKVINHRLADLEQEKN